ncbi:hypothetical protein [Tardiphaga robiniae]|uniref:hypothetical protein n=1 Tax=Tardiphaga robiniae TaxID=943830 RepID=UPI001586F1B9|nr:hypothetical protein [Tardiphaga robiniae]NUU41388.1 hypothetical protein [Tardiphaga robiniae]
MAALLAASVTGVGAAPASVYPGEGACRQWTYGKDKIDDLGVDDTQQAAYSYWLGGFFDAAAVTRGYKLPDHLDRGAFLNDLWAYCKAFPDERLPRASTLILLRMTTKPKG